MAKKQQEVQERHLLLLNDRGIRVVELVNNVVSLGRQTVNDIVVDCELISRIHSTFFRVPLFNTRSHQYRIIDGSPKQTRSKHGIAVNRKRCLMHNLEHGDIITFSQGKKAPIQGIYLKIKIIDEKFPQYLSIILKTKEITEKTRDSIDVLSRAFRARRGTSVLELEAKDSGVHP